MQERRTCRLPNDRLIHHSLVYAERNQSIHTPSPPNSLFDARHLFVFQGLHAFILLAHDPED